MYNVLEVSDMAQTDKRSAILQFIEQFISQHGYGPSVREICDAVSLKSTATAHYHLRMLADNKLIIMDHGKKRAISLPRTDSKADAALDDGDDAYQKTVFDSVLTIRSSGALLPILGNVAAGQPILAEEQIDGYLPWEGGSDWFALRVRGESMKNAGILSGDLVVVRPQCTAENGEIVVALLGDEATVKRFSKKNGHILLLPENDAFSPINGDEAVILGLVRGVVRKYS